MMCLDCSIRIMGIDMKSAEMLMNPVDWCEADLSDLAGMEGERCDVPHLSSTCYVICRRTVDGMLSLSSCIFSRGWHNDK